MILCLKYRLYPNGSQIEAMERHLNETCDLYNCALEERRGAWKTCRKSVSFFDQCSQLKHLRSAGLINVDNFNCAKEVLQRVDRAYKAFFSRVKRGEKPGFPRFRSLRRYDSFTFPIYGNGCRLFDRVLRIQGIGEIKIKLHRPVEGQIKTVSLKRESGKWFALLCVEGKEKPLPESKANIGIDLGISSFVTLSDGSEIDNPRYGEHSARILRIASRRLARRTNKQSNRRRKALQVLQRCHQRTVNQRNDFHHKVSRLLINRYGVLCVEDLNIKGLAKGRLARSVNDAGWGSFLRKLAYKAESAGRELVKVNPNGTSQTCICGAKVPKTLKQRRHDCVNCGLSAGRDHVSAQIILGLGQSLRESTWPEVRASVSREVSRCA